MFSGTLYFTVTRFVIFIINLLLLGVVMKILKTFDNAKLIIVELEVNMGDKKRSAPTLCASIDDKIIPLSSAHDGRPILMNLDNALKQ